jgi:hypothetical protein
MQDRSPTRAGTPRGDRPGACCLRPTRAARVKSAGRGGHDGEREKQKILPRVRSELDGAKADEDREGKERCGKGDGGEREEHLCVDFFHTEFLLPLDVVAGDLRRVDDYGFNKRRATADESSTPLVC